MLCLIKPVECVKWTNQWTGKNLFLNNLVSFVVFSERRIWFENTEKMARKKNSSSNNSNNNTTINFTVFLTPVGILLIFICHIHRQTNKQMNTFFICTTQDRAIAYRTYTHTNAHTWSHTMKCSPNYSLFVVTTSTLFFTSLKWNEE